MLDKLLMLCEDLDLSQAGGAGTTYDGTDAFPLAVTGSIKRELQGNPMELVVQFTEAVAGGTSIDVRMISGNTSALGSPQIQMSTGALTSGAAECGLGKKIRFPLDLPQTDADATHIGVTFYIIGTTTTGKATAWIQPAGSDQQVF